MSSQHVKSVLLQIVKHMLLVSKTNPEDEKHGTR